MDRLHPRQGNNGHHRTAQPAAHGISPVLVVSRDSQTIEQIASALDTRAEIQLTCLSSIDADEVATSIQPGNLVILEVESIPQFPTVLTAMENAGLPVICVAREQDVAALVRVMPTVGIPILVKPLDPDLVLSLVDTTLRREVQARTLAEKYRRMRQLVRRVVRERRDINRRVELVCRDLVEAHRRLTHRFVEMQKSQAAN